jgi:hypothetical protein
LIEVFIKNICMNVDDANEYAEALDRASRAFNGYREILLDDGESNWDSWYFPDDRVDLLSLFVKDTTYLCQKRTGYV